MAWFEKHLNWTVLLAWILTLCIVLTVDFGLVATDSYMSKEDLAAAGIGVCLLVLPASWGWVLRRKRRTLWWLLPALFLPSGFLCLVRLENQTPAWYMDPERAEFGPPNE